MPVIEHEILVIASCLSEKARKSKSSGGSGDLNSAFRLTIKISDALKAVYTYCRSPLQPLHPFLLTLAN